MRLINNLVFVFVFKKMIVQLIIWVIVTRLNSIMHLTSAYEPRDVEYMYPYGLWKLSAALIE
jgi:hypothetical protein